MSSNNQPDITDWLNYVRSLILIGLFVGAIGLPLHWLFRWLGWVD